MNESVKNNKSSNDVPYFRSGFVTKECMPAIFGSVATPSDNNVLHKEAKSTTNVPAIFGNSNSLKSNISKTLPNIFGSVTPSTENDTLFKGAKLTTNVPAIFGNSDTKKTLNSSKPMPNLFSAIDNSTETNMPFKYTKSTTNVPAIFGNSDSTISDTSNPFKPIPNIFGSVNNATEQNQLFKDSRSNVPAIFGNSDRKICDFENKFKINPTPLSNNSIPELLNNSNSMRNDICSNIPNATKITTQPQNSYLTRDTPSIFRSDNSFSFNEKMQTMPKSVSLSKPTIRLENQCFSEIGLGKREEAIKGRKVGRDEDRKGTIKGIQEKDSRIQCRGDVGRERLEARKDRYDREREGRREKDTREKGRRQKTRSDKDRRKDGRREYSRGVIEGLKEERRKRGCRVNHKIRGGVEVRRRGRAYMGKSNDVNEVSVCQRDCPYPYDLYTQRIECEQIPPDNEVSAKTRRHTVDIAEFRKLYDSALAADEGTVNTLPVKKLRGLDAQRKLDEFLVFAKQPPTTADDIEDGGVEEVEGEEGDSSESAEGCVNTEDGEDDETAIRKKRALLKMSSLFDRRGQPDLVIDRPQRNDVCFEDEDDDDDRGRYEEPVFKRIVANSLSELKSVHSNTTEERLAALVAYDELVQKRDEPQGYRIIGTCVDMCPERERYTREFQRRVSRFEMASSQHEETICSAFTNLLDHNLAVKEYSRSSADQEVPLPNTLRTPELLEYSMNYLLQVIANRGGDGCWEGWFDFLWDRTRAIRKDLIQQELTNNMSTQLMEKCVRFHIFSSMRLCEELPPVYDNKINDENLTKCLQTLKEFYQLTRDEPNKDGHIQTHEAEFRCYIMLLNIKDADCIRRTEQLFSVSSSFVDLVAAFREMNLLPVDVQNSREMRFARDVFLAYAGKNYLRFFRLLRSATYMQACLMHRYVACMHHHALSTLQAAYDPKEITLLDYYELQDDLAFEDVEELLKMCREYGITIHMDTKQLELDNDYFVLFEDKKTFLLRRFAFIENKLTTSIGEVINGGRIDFIHNHVTLNSFDDDGAFNRGYPEPPPIDPGFVFDKNNLPIYERRVYTSDERDDEKEIREATSTSRFHEVQRLRRVRRGVRGVTGADGSEANPDGEVEVHAADTLHSNKSRKTAKDRVRRSLSRNAKNSTKSLGDPLPVGKIVDPTRPDFFAEMFKDLRNLESQRTDLPRDCEYEEFLNAVKEFFEEFIQEQLTLMTQQILSNPTFMVKLFTQELFQEVLNEETSTICQELHSEGCRVLRHQVSIERKARERLLTRKHSMDMRVFKKEYAPTLGLLLIDEYTESVVDEVYLNAVTQRNDEITVDTQRLTKENAAVAVLYDYVDELLEEIAFRQHNSLVRAPLARAARFSAVLHQRMFKQALGVWKLHYADLCKVIEFNEKIKNLKPPKTIHESVDTLLPDRIPIMDSIHSISIGKTTNMFYKRNKICSKNNENIFANYKQQIKKINDKINIDDIFDNMSTIAINGDNCLYYKLLLCNERDDNHWVRSKFTSEDFSEDQVHVLQKESSGKRFSCITELLGTVTTDTRRSVDFSDRLKGTNSVLFVLDSNFTDDDVYWLKELKRLSSVIKCLSVSTPVSLVITATFYNKFNTSLIKDLLHFSKSHLFSERIREIFFMNFTDAPYQDSLMLKDVMIDLMNESFTDIPVIHYPSLIHYIDITLECLYYSRLHIYNFSNPICLIKLYNSCIDYAIDQLTNDKLQGLSYPVFEFANDHKDLPVVSWNSVDRFNEIRGHLSAMRLKVKRPSGADPPLTTPPSAEDPRDSAERQWHRIDLVVAEVCDQACRIRRNYPGEFVHNSMSAILETCRSKYHNRFGGSWSDDQLPHWTLDVDWPRIIETLIKCRVQAVRDIDKNGNIMPVYTMCTEHIAFEEPTEWLTAISEPKPIRETTKLEIKISPVKPSELESSNFNDCKNNELKFENFLKAASQTNQTKNVFLETNFPVDCCDIEEDGNTIVFQNSTRVPVSRNFCKRISSKCIDKLHDNRKRSKLLIIPPSDNSLSSPFDKEINSLNELISEQCAKEAEFEFRIMNALNI